MKDNGQLEALAEAFVKERTKENFAKLMEQLEKSVVFLPTMMPENLENDAKKMAKEGKGIKLPKDTKITPCLLRKKTGEQALPIFSSGKHILEDKKSPAIMALPFFTCVSMAMENADKVEAIILNPFTQTIVLSKQILEVALKRSKQPKKQVVKLTEQQFHQLAHRRIAYELLPAFLYEKQQEGLEQLQKEEGKFLLSKYASVYPKEIQVPYGEEAFSFMTLNITDTLQLTRIDMPEKNMAKGLANRIYIVWKRDTRTLEYYTIERAEKGSEIGRVYADRKHVTVEAAPDNGAEIETIIRLASESAQ
ncbi:MAG: SseB family protein [Blautia sp.]|nr:SseB family protein [Lachnoclostridium sp.]MCM1212443.1 SseB family protein [Blautia sp.]